ncbi:DUF4435 domain-containing protein [Mycobacterium mantenii]|uniref:DUF4435 domain-containing protein n=1 Tax=Mycobacterium mantenii TaxID=560555 RepID=UPI0009ED0C9E|nr:DUF4435 domain-containing protein [Mycobacterium mantenii]
MRQLLDGDTLYADLLMMRQVDHRIVILVEGEEDVAIVDPHLNTTTCRSEIGHGKRAVLRATELAKANGLDKVLAAVDRDFDDEKDIRAYSEHISISDFYDLEVDILVRCNDLIQRVLASHADRDRLKSYLERKASSVITMIFEVAGHVGALRYASATQKLPLNLAKFPTGTLVQAYENGQLLEEIARIAAGKSKESGYSDSDIVPLLREAVGAVDFVAVACGHDVMGVLSAFIRVRWGGSSGADATGRACRSSVDWECFQRLRICQDFRSWGKEFGAAVWQRDDAA